MFEEMKCFGIIILCFVLSSHGKIHLVHIKSDQYNVRDKAGTILKNLNMEIILVLVSFYQINSTYSMKPRTNNDKNKLHNQRNYNKYE